MKFENYNFIGIFDSGIGGVSVLNSTIKLMPNENYIYFADSNNFPYGTKSIEAITNIGLDILSHFNDLHSKEVIIACNTMSTSNMPLFKKSFKNMNIIGTFPDFTTIFKETNNIISNKTIYFDKINGIKVKKNKLKLLIIATSATVKSQYLKKLIETFKNVIDIYIEPADFIVKAVESDNLENFEFNNNLSRLFKEYYDINYLMLGCTHFPHAEKYINKYINKNTKIITGGDIASYNAYNYLLNSNFFCYNSNPNISVIDNSIDEKKIALYMKLIKSDTHNIKFYHTFNEI